MENTNELIHSISRQIVRSAIESAKSFVDCKILSSVSTDQKYQFDETSQNHINQLPCEVLSDIFSCLTQTARIQVLAQVCKKWACIATNPHLLRRCALSLTNEIHTFQTEQTGGDLSPDNDLLVKQLDENVGNEATEEWSCREASSSAQESPHSQMQFGKLRLLLCRVTVLRIELSSLATTPSFNPSHPEFIGILTACRNLQCLKLSGCKIRLPKITTTRLGEPLNNERRKNLSRVLSECCPRLCHLDACQLATGAQTDLVCMRLQSRLTYFAQVTRRRLDAGSVSTGNPLNLREFFLNNNYASMNHVVTWLCANYTHSLQLLTINNCSSISEAEFTMLGNRLRQLTFLHMTSCVLSDAALTWAIKHFVRPLLLVNKESSKKALQDESLPGAGLEQLFFSQHNTNVIIWDALFESLDSPTKSHITNVNSIKPKVGMFSQLRQLQLYSVKDCLTEQRIQMLVSCCGPTLQTLVLSNSRPGIDSKLLFDGDAALKSLLEGCLNLRQLGLLKLTGCSARPFLNVIPVGMRHLRRLNLANCSAEHIDRELLVSLTRHMALLTICAFDQRTFISANDKYASENDDSSMFRIDPNRFTTSFCSHNLPVYTHNIFQLSI